MVQELVVVVVRQEIATALTLRKQLALDPLRTINGRPAQTLTLVLRTTDQFIWREVLGDGRPLPAAPIPVDPELVRPMERRVLASWSDPKPLMLRSNRCGSGPVHRSDFDVDLGLVAAGTLNPQKARVLLLLAVIAGWTPTRLSNWFSASPG